MLGYLRPVLAALRLAHSKGFIHRDIKGANILVGDDGCVKLTDFGIARVISGRQTPLSSMSVELTRPGTILGTLQYMSPEQIEGKIVDIRSDIYSLGVLMYHCLTGVLPFKSDTDWSIMHKITKESPTRPGIIKPDIPRQAEEMILKCMEKNAKDRYQNCDELSAAIEQLDNILTAANDTFLTSTDDTVIQAKPFLSGKKKNVLAKNREGTGSKLNNTTSSSADETIRLPQPAATSQETLQWNMIKTSVMTKVYTRLAVMQKNMPGYSALKKIGMSAGGLALFVITIIVWSSNRRIWFGSL